MKINPGSLLIVRKMLRMGVTGQNKLHPASITFFKENTLAYNPILVPFGDAILVLSYKKMPYNVYNLVVLWNNKHLETKINNLHANRWLATPNNWTKYKLGDKYEEYISDGSMTQLWASCKLYDRCIGMKVPRP